MCGIGSLCWMLVRFMEGPKSAIELPARDLIETEDADMNAATLYSMLGAGEPEKPEAMLPAAGNSGPLGWSPAGDPEKSTVVTGMS